MSTEYFGLISEKDALDFAVGMRKFILYDDCENHNPSKWDYAIAAIKQERDLEVKAWQKKEWNSKEGKELREKIENYKKNPPEPNTALHNGNPECRHKFKVWGTNRHIFYLRCEKCKATTQRAPTAREKRKVIARDKRQDKKSMTLHKISHAFQRKFQNNMASKFEMKGWKLIQAIERFTKKYPSIQQVGVDDDYHAGSDLFLIPHETASEYWGTSVVYVPQCTGEAPIRFFLYPGHLNDLVDALVKIQKRTTKKNKVKGRKGDDY